MTRREPRTGGDRARPVVERFNELAEDVLLAETEVSAVTGFSRNTLKRWRVLGRGPVAVRFGRSVRYRVRDVRAFMTGVHAA